MALSVSCADLVAVIRGIKESIFSSRAAQRIIRFLEEQAIKVLIVSLERNRKRYGSDEYIRQRKGLNFSRLKLEVFPHLQILLSLFSQGSPHFIHGEGPQLR